MTPTLSRNASEDAFTSPNHPGVTLTSADLDELPETDRRGDAFHVIVVQYDDASRGA